MKAQLLLFVYVVLYAVSAIYQPYSSGNYHWKDINFDVFKSYNTGVFFSWRPIRNKHTFPKIQRKRKCTCFGWSSSWKKENRIRNSLKRIYYTHDNDSYLQKKWNRIFLKCIVLLNSTYWLNTVSTHKNLQFCFKLIRKLCGQFWLKFCFLKITRMFLNGIDWYLEH